MRAFLDAVARWVNALWAKLPPRWQRLFRQFTQVGIVGLGGFVVDVGVFNLLRWLAPEWGPILPKVISTGLAIVANWFGNRYWTFRNERRQELVREAVEFILVSVGGSLIALGCLWVSHYALGFDNLLADNISGNVIGLVLGTLFRFVFYKLWVFHPSRGTPVVAPTAVEGTAPEHDPVAG